MLIQRGCKDTLFHGIFHVACVPGRTVGEGDRAVGKQLTDTGSQLHSLCAGDVVIGREPAVSPAIDEPGADRRVQVFEIPGVLVHVAKAAGGQRRSAQREAERQREHEHGNTFFHGDLPFFWRCGCCMSI